jgi:hypothetical protein
MCHGVTSEKFPVFAILTMIAHRGAFRGVVKEGRQSFAYAQAPPPAAFAAGHSIVRPVFAVNRQM